VPRRVNFRIKFFTNFAWIVLNYKKRWKTLLKKWNCIGEKSWENWEVEIFEKKKSGKFGKNLESPVETLIAKIFETWQKMKILQKIIKIPKKDVLKNWSVKIFGNKT